jgi:hypothetical protein
MKNIIQSWPLKAGSAYLRGFRKIEKLVEQHGQQILLKIPKEWRELENAGDSSAGD